ncbi:DUF1850 domain-containing protein [Spirabiliibacterium falconis]|uniref:DUF1850 domain-containing protein n=1 Tax=Spirabiliibacterium falconis TaxID=572023 RepID=UPI001AADB4C4|nr:DUF1850 domain-containing protein [Spirabiliibacterium falconis]MBE2895077.1 DUF1850 domain-containing protein [Spirabiliibacterium falconis]
MRKHQKCGLIGIVLTALLSFYPLQGIEVKSQNINCLLHTSAFQLRWRHSVEYQLWIEQYRVEKQNIVLFATWLQTFGAGTPSQGEYIAAPPGFIGLKQDITLPELNWAVSRNMQGVLLANNDEFELYQRVPDYSNVTIRVAKRPIYLFLWRKCQ